MVTCVFGAEYLYYPFFLFKILTAAIKWSARVRTSLKKAIGRRREQK
jgi:hypothetical protein